MTKVRHLEIYWAGCETGLKGKNIIRMHLRARSCV